MLPKKLSIHEKCYQGMFVEEEKRISGGEHLCENDVISEASGNDRVSVSSPYKYDFPDNSSLQMPSSCDDV